MHQEIGGDQQQFGDQNAHQTGSQTHNEGLCIEHTADIPLGCTHGTENTDLLGSLQNGNVGDDADHNGGNHQRNAHKGNEDIADGIDDGGNRGHHQAYHIGVNDLIVFVLALVVIVDDLRNGILCLKILGVDVDGAGLLQIGNTHFVQVAFIGGAGAGVHHLVQHRRKGCGNFLIGLAFCPIFFNLTGEHRLVGLGHHGQDHFDLGHGVHLGFCIGVSKG